MKALYRTAMDMIRRLRSSEQVIASVVRPTDVQAENRRQQTDAKNLCDRYVKWVKVAASRNAAAVASTPMRWYRRKNAKSAFASRVVEAKTLAARRKTWAYQATKSADMLDDDIEEIVDRDYPGLVLFDRAWPGGSWFELLELTQLWIGLAGNAYWAKVYGNGGWPTELWPLAPQYVRVKPHPTEFIECYYYGRGPEIERKYSPESVLHFKNPNPKGDPYYGLGDLAACIGDADISAQFSDFTLALLENGGNPSTIITVPKATKQSAEELERRINAKYAGVNKAGRMWVIHGGDIEIKTLDGSSQKEKPFLQSEAQVRDVIANAFDMPIAMLTLDNAALATGKVAAPQWQTYGVRPRCKRIEDVLNEYLVPDFRRALGDESIFVGFDETVQEDEESNSKRASLLFSSGLAKRNESRMIAGLDAVPDEEDVYYEPVADVPVVSDGKEEGADDGDAPIPSTGGEVVQDTALNGAQVTALQEMVRGAAAGEIPLASVKPMMMAAFPLVPDSLVNQIVTSLQGFEPRQPEPVDVPEEPMPAKSFESFYWTADPHFHGVHKAREQPPKKEVAAMEASLRQVFVDLGPVVQRAAAQGEPAIGAALARYGFESQIMDAMSDGLQTMMLEGYDVGRGEVASRSTIDPFDLASPDARRFLDTYRIRLARSVSETAEANLRGAVRTSLEEGVTIPELQERIATSVDGMSQYGAERIARTESARAYMHGREAAWEKSGVVTAKEWILSGDPCPQCVAFAQKFNRVDIGQSFLARGQSFEDNNGQRYVMDYSDVQGPPLHPGCRCSLGAVFAEGV